MQLPLRVLLQVAQLIVYPAEQFCDKIFGGHERVLLLRLPWSVFAKVYRFLMTSSN
jgi:hypothetical protein